MIQLPTSSPDISIVGYLIPWVTDIDRPVILTLDGVEVLPIFSTDEKLADARNIMPVSFDWIKRIDNQAEFLESIKSLMIIVDPYITEHGKVRFKRPII